MACNILSFRRIAFQNVVKGKQTQSLGFFLKPDTTDNNTAFGDIPKINLNI